MDKSTTCCFTGHRKLPENRIPDILSRLEEVLERLIQEGVREFCAGGALGFDTLAALRVLEFKKQYPDVRLVLILPCKDQTKYWSESDISVYENIRECADEVIYTSEHSYSGCMHVRNRALVDRSSWCVCCLIQARGGTKYTVGYAQKKGLRIINVAESSEEAATDQALDTSAVPMPEIKKAEPKTPSDTPGKRKTTKTAKPAKDSKIQEPAKPQALLDIPETTNSVKPTEAHVRVATLKEPGETPDVCSYAFRARLAGFQDNF